MKILFAGTPEIAVPSLTALAEQYDISAVLTNPDQPSGRSRVIAVSPVKQEALRLGLDVLQPGKIDSEFENTVQSLGADLLVVIAFGKIFRESFLNIFPMGAVNVHPSLLPKYRGPSPLNAAILNGDSETGITLQKMVKRLDAGDIYLQETFPLKGTETAADLTFYAAQRSPDLLLKLLKEEFERGNFSSIPQNEDNATYCHLIRKEDGKIDWRKPAVVIEREIRAYNPWPRSTTVLGDRELYIYKAAVCKSDDEKREPGSVLGVDKTKGILIQTGNGVLAMETLQLQSKKVLDFKSFLNGNPQIKEAKLGESR